MIHPQKDPQEVSRWILVTGCSGGIGRALVEALGRRGWGVVATARSLEALAPWADRPNIRILELDVTRADQIEAVRSACEDLRLVGLINNAGYGQFGPLEILRPEELRDQFETNVIGLQALTNALLPQIRRCARPGEGRIVHMASALGRLSIPFMGAYNASKHAVVALAETLRLEIGREIPVILVEPGVVETHFRSTLVEAWGDLPERVKGTAYESAIQSYSLRGMAFPEDRATPVHRCAEKIACALDRRRPPRRLLVGLDSRFSQLAHRLLPAALFEWGVRKNYGIG